MRSIPAIFALVLAPSLFAETISGRAFDPSGAIVPGARVVLLEDFNKRAETKSDDKGEFVFADLQPATYQVQIKAVRFNLFQQLVPLQANQHARVFAVLNVARVGSAIEIGGLPAAEALPASSVPTTHRAGGSITGPKRIGGRMPSFVDAARKRGASGAVVLYATVKADGTIADVLVLDSPDADLARECVEAYSSWKYEPMQLNGQPIDCRELFVFEFRYR